MNLILNQFRKFIPAIAFFIPFLSIGTNLKYQLLSGIAVSITLILVNFKNEIKLHFSDYFLFGFLFFFNLSFLFAQTPFGFKEFLTFNLGCLVYLSYGNFKKYAQIDFLAPKLYLVFSFINIVYLILFVNSPNDRFSSIFTGDQIFSIYPNVLATFLLFLIPYGAFHYAKTTFKADLIRKLILLLTVFLNTISFWLTASRGATIAFAFIFGATIAFCLIKNKNLKKLITQISISLVVILVTILISAQIQSLKTYNFEFANRFLPNQDISAQVSVNERFEFFSNSFKIFQEYPFFGTGPGSFSYFNPIFQTQSLVNSEHPHNLFLKILSESGLFTAISFTAWIAILIIYFGRSILHSLKRKHVISLIVLIGLLIASLVDYNFGFPIIWILFFGLLGFLRTELFNSAYSVSPTFKAINVWILTLVLTLIILFQSVVFTFSMSQKLQNSFIYDFIANNIILNKLAFHNDFIVSVDNASLSEDYFKKYTYSYPNFNLSYLALAKNTTNLNLKSQAYLNYLKLDKFNNFEPYYYLLQNSPDSVNYDFLLDLLEQYTYLISLNTHQTVTSSQPNFVYLIYELLIEQKPNNLLLRDQFLQFQTVLFAEQQKFDTRYKTHLNKQFVKWKQEKS